MVFKDYKVNYNVTPEDTFLYNITEQLHGLGSNVGFVTGDFYGLIEKLKEAGVSKEIITKAEESYKSVEALFGQYFDVQKKVVDEWVRRGKPKSVECQLQEKAISDEKDDIKAEYYDR